MADVCQSCGLPRNDHTAFHPFVSLQIDNYVHKEKENKGEVGDEVCKICGTRKNNHFYLIHEFAK